MHGTGYLLSEYYGLVFFQPEIAGKRNISMKLYSFIIQFATLIFLSFYFVSLESTLSNLSTFGGHSFDKDGMYQVEIYVEGLLHNMAMLELFYPRNMTDDFFQLTDFQSFIEENPGGYYAMMVGFADVLQLESKLIQVLITVVFNLADCQLKSARTVFNDLNVF